MIRPPQRAVIRFFIPLIDVLILLFCIFLLMPFVSGTPEAKDGPVPKSAEAILPQEVEELQRQLRIANRQIAEMKKDQARLFDHFRVVVLEIDGKTGKLYAFSEPAPARQEVRNQADATRLIDRARGRAGLKEICVLLLYPREVSGFPLREQTETFHRWFRDVPHAFDNPWLASSTKR